MEPGAIGDVLEGQARPGHFRGMLTVVERLLSITHANYSFFGEKDFQQLTLVKAMVTTTKMPIEIVGVPTVRDEFGIALSSRNRRLSVQAIEHAKLIPTAKPPGKRSWNKVESLKLNTSKSDPMI
jgi:pantoate--beta-alanine ligase